MITAEHVIAAIAAELQADAGALDPDGGPGTIEGWDSLKSIHIVLVLEKLIGRRLDLEGLASATTIRDLTRLVLESSASRDERQGVRVAAE